ncbi:hypothetical protein STEG23_017120 [Scotinomys teguina]
MCITDKQLLDLQEPETASGYVVDGDRSPILFVQKSIQSTRADETLRRDSSKTGRYWTCGDVLPPTPEDFDISRNDIVANNEFYGISVNVGISCQISKTFKHWDSDEFCVSNSPSKKKQDEQYG